LIRIAIILWFGLLIGVPVRAAPISFSEIPLYLSARADPNVLFNMSVEWPTGGAAYNDHTDLGSGGQCPGRPPNEDGYAIGQCYFANKTYLGYFDPNKCYEYSSNRFNPSGATNALHECSGKWSGNFLNWATMTAIDEFRKALTGGNRSTDTATTTVLERAYQDRPKGNGVVPIKKISASDTVVNGATIPGVNPASVTPYSGSKLYLYNVQNAIPPQIEVGDAADDTDEYASGLNVRVKVCDLAQGLENNCTAYGSSYKPEGLVQKNAHRMRFALTSYLLDNSRNRDGGVLRARMKYSGPQKYVSGSGMAPNDTGPTTKEWSEIDGTFFTNPDAADAALSVVPNSGVINYINKFG
ncbi:MAG: hypothetical protein ACREBC_37150, partial [Pyrinomonadaceae bacterium]